MLGSKELSVSVSPDIEDLVAETLMRHRRAPLQIASDAARLQTCSQPALSDGLGVFRPSPGRARLLNEVAQCGLESREVKEKVRGRANFNGVLAVRLAKWRLEFVGVK